MSRSNQTFWRGATRLRDALRRMGPSCINIGSLLNLKGLSRSGAQFSAGQPHPGPAFSGATLIARRPNHDAEDCRFWCN